MKKTFALLMTLSALTYAGSASACTVRNVTSENTREIVTQHGGWPISDAKCDLLNKNNLMIMVTTRATVLAGTSVGWAVVMLTDKNHVISDEERSSTYVNSAAQPSMDLANGLAYSALTDAIEGLNFEKAINELKARQKAGGAR